MTIFHVLAMLMTCQAVAATSMARIRKFTDSTCTTENQTDDGREVLGKCTGVRGDGVLNAYTSWSKFSCKGTDAIHTVYSDDKCMTVKTTVTGDGYTNGVRNNKDACTGSGTAQWTIFTCADVSAVSVTVHSDAVCSTTASSSTTMYALNTCSFHTDGKIIKATKYTISGSTFKETGYSSKDCSGMGSAGMNGTLPCVAYFNGKYVKIKVVATVDSTSSSLPQSLPAAAIMMALVALGMSI